MVWNDPKVQDREYPVHQDREQQSDSRVHRINVIHAVDKLVLEIPGLESKRKRMTPGFEDVVFPGVAI